MTSCHGLYLSLTNTRTLHRFSGDIGLSQLDCCLTHSGQHPNSASILWGYRFEPALLLSHTLLISRGSAKDKTRLTGQVLPTHQLCSNLHQAIKLLCASYKYLKVFYNEKTGFHTSSCHENYTARWS
ncbi:hypothetical protein RRG08_019443 [Elysia crispata]|uniref:Uncharacterized protein n=1 Tax=Elysia crispata TaxID=231223 RepID=A0AAE0YBI9_9GAST|nr:hypothetical protein RRG08_019443 [Elysia crispata]